MSEPGRRDQTAPCVLCADDFAMGEGISDAIGELAQAGHLSATSAVVTGPLWRGFGTRIAQLRARIAVGLHLNFTWGAPLDAMPELAPSAQFPRRGTIIWRALLGRIPTREIAEETERQMRAFAEVAGAPPDFVDGHEHVHALPGVRAGVVAGIARFDPSLRLPLRDPSDAVRAIIERGVAVPKALGVAALVNGFARLAQRAGHTTNAGFSGFSSYKTASPYSAELRRFFVRPGPRHLIMCHPGCADIETRDSDPIAARRQEEYATLMSATWLPAHIWRPLRPRAALWSLADA